MNLHDRKFRLLTSLLFVAVISILSPGCGGKKSAGDDDEAASSNVQPVVEVETTPVVKTDIAATVEVTGKVDAVRRQRILSPVSGIVLSFPQLEGQSVTAGTVLAEIRTKESQSAIAGAEAILRSATTPELRQQAQHDLDLANNTQTALKITAGFNGVLANRLIGPGELVSENTELVTLVDLSSIYFSADVPTATLHSLHAGQHCEMNFPSLATASVGGVVEGIGAQSDVQTQTVKVRIRFTSLSAAERTLLKTDMPGSAAIVTSIHKGVLVVPRNAIIRDDEKKTTEIVVVRESVAIRVPVQTGFQNDSLVEISGNGIIQDTRVVTTGASTLPDSTRVKQPAAAE